MDKLAYCGHPYQLYGVEEHRLVGGRADGLRVLEVKNGRGLQFTILLDRGCGIAHLSYLGTNCSFLSASGLRRPEYFDHEVGPQGFLRNFHAGFLTTCGVYNVGVPCVDDGEQTFLHGDLDNIPAEYHSHYVGEDGNLHIECTIFIEQIFYHKVVLKRHFTVGLESDFIHIHDDFENKGSTKCPLMVLYHMNMGYPLLDEDAQLFINSKSYKGRTPLACQDKDKWNLMCAPEHNYEERCYYHSFEGNEALAAIYQPKRDVGLAINFDPQNLPFFTQWKQMGYRDYALGLEPGNSHCDGRDKMRSEGKLQFLIPGQKASFEVKVNLFAGKASFEQLKKQYQRTDSNTPDYVES